MVDPVDFILDLKYENIPEKALDTARICLLDAVGCLLGGVENPGVLKLARTIAQKYPGPSMIGGTSLTSSRAWAAFANTHACSYFDLDDGHRKAQGHPGGIIIPISLMMAAEHDLTGKDLLTAVVAGYEIAIRSALIVREAGGPRKGSGGWSIIGAVAVVARLSGFSKKQTRNALGLAEYYAPQAPQDRSLRYPSCMKEGMAWSAHAAISITELAEMGFEGMEPSLTESGFAKDLGKNWEICSTYFKMYGCCRFSHPVLDGLAAHFKGDINPEEIVSIAVTSFAKAMLLNHLAPANPVAAMYSIPFIIGCFVVNGRVGPKEMTAKSLRDKKILAIAKKVTLEEDTEITAQFPLKCLARVSVVLKNGQALNSEILAAKGDPDNPYSEAEMVGKFVELTSGFGRKRGEKLVQKIMNIENESAKILWESLRLTH